MKISIKREQNDACIGSAEREKFGTMFKKTFRFLSMAALLVVGAIMTGCSSDDNIDNPQQPANKDNVVTLTATVSLDGGAGTRAITPGGTAADPWTKTFESTNKIAVIYQNGDGTQKAESGTLTLSADGTKATFTVSLTSPTSNSAIRYIYPASMAKTPATTATITDDAATIDYSGLFSSQNGDLTTLGTNYDLAVFDGALSGTDLPTSTTLANPLAICKFTFKDTGSNDITSITRLTVSDGTNAYGISTSGLSEIYVAMKPVASGNIAFTAATASKTYFRTVTGKSLAASKLYTNITVGSMVELTLGKVFCSDGSVYADASAATTAGKTPVAKIAYLGKDSETSTANIAFKNGLALALEDVSGTKAWCSQNSVTCLGTGHQFDSEAGAKGDMAGIDNTDALVNHIGHTHDAASAARGYNSGTHPTGTSAWFLPSAGQWNKMATAAGSYANLKTNTGLELAHYWSSTEVSALYAWLFRSDDGSWFSGGRVEGNRVRAVLAF